MLKLTNYLKYKDAKELEELLQFVAEKLAITSGEVILFSKDKTLDLYSTEDISIEAILHPSQLLHTYDLILREKEDCTIESILCHEMIHLSQYERGDLKLDWDKKEFYWKGKKYENSFPYRQRPWEKEAFKEQSKLLKEWRKHKRELKKLQKKESKK